MPISKTVSTSATAKISQHAKQAVLAVRDEGYSHIPEDEKILWAMSNVIHCDMIRLIDAWNNSDKNGLASVLSVGDIVSKLVEARRWYTTKGYVGIKTIVERKGLDPDAVNSIKQLSSKHPINQIDEYKKYRNKMGYHYDLDAIDHLYELGTGTEEADVIKILKIFLEYSHAWVRIIHPVLQS